ncbi:polysaccharide deacetylase family protein [Ramlibacter sp. PS3R-8]|uniref:polysaccharide deacetylase family protein n=1 Tax=Ramlibacter sp. PS3R-8 TaxID=3133437 RepID=UPI0030969782
MLKLLRPTVRDLAGDLLYTIGLTRADRGAHRLNVVTFHRVLPPAQLREYPLAAIAVSVADFTWFVGYFAEHYTVDTFAGAARRWDAGERPARPFLAITFDDGQRDNALHAVPVLERFGVRASFFVPVQAVEDNETLWHDRLGYAAARLLRTDRAAAARALARLGAPDLADVAATVQGLVERAKGLTPAERDAFVDATERAAGGNARPAWDGMMTWEQLRAMAARGHEVGSHSMTHQLLPQLDDAGLAYEVAESRRVLEAKLGSRVETFCYPNGDADARVVQAVQDAGYARALGTRWGPNEPGANRYQLSRCDMQGATTRTRKGVLSESRLAFRLSPLQPRP